MADEIIEKMRADGALPAGTNGPWNDNETPVRNTGYGAITLLSAYDSTGEKKYVNAAERAVNYLLSAGARPHGVTFHHRISDQRDSCNGLIGQAWTIEALATAAQTIDNPEIVTTATSVFLAHPFNERLRLWRQVEIDGTVQSICMTFNQQLWFAAAGGLLAQHSTTDPVVDHRVRLFLDEFEKNVNLYDSGIIKHLYEPEFDVGKYLSVFIDGVRSGTAHKMALGLARSFVDSWTGDTTDEQWRERAVGYHSFNLYGLGLLKECYPDHPVWNSEAIDRVLAVAQTDEFAAELDGNPYGFPYNCTGIELAYALAVFDRGTKDERHEWLRRQFDRTYDPEQGTLSRNTTDPVTLSARAYEATRLPDHDVPVIDRTAHSSE